MRVYTFSKVCGELYGTLIVDTDTEEICLIDIANERAEKFAFPRVCRAFKTAFTRGILPEEFSYAA